MDADKLYLQYLDGSFRYNENNYVLPNYVIEDAAAADYVLRRAKKQKQNLSEDFVKRTLWDFRNSKEQALHQEFVRSKNILEYNNKQNKHICPRCGTEGTEHSIVYVGVLKRITYQCDCGCLFI